MRWDRVVQFLSVWGGGRDWFEAVLVEHMCLCLGCRTLGAVERVQVKDISSVGYLFRGKSELLDWITRKENKYPPAAEPLSKRKVRPNRPGYFRFHVWWKDATSGFQTTCSWAGAPGPTQENMAIYHLSAHCACEILRNFAGGT